MKEKLFQALGSAGSIIYWILLIAVGIMPFVVINLPFWLDLLLMAVCFFIPATSGIFWAWGLIATICGPQDVIAVIYYILFAIMFLPFLPVRFLSLLQAYVKVDKRCGLLKEV